MKEIFGHKHVTAEDLQEFEIHEETGNPLPFLTNILADNKG